VIPRSSWHPLRSPRETPHREACCA
jgi:hypothetical protein